MGRHRWGTPWGVTVGGTVGGHRLACEVTDGDSNGTSDGGPLGAFWVHTGVPPDGGFSGASSGPPGGRPPRLLRAAPSGARARHSGAALGPPGSAREHARAFVRRALARDQSPNVAAPARHAHLLLRCASLLWRRWRQIEGRAPCCHCSLKQRLENTMPHQTNMKKFCFQSGNHSGTVRAP